MRRYVKQSNHMNNNSESEFRPYRLCSTKTPNHITTKPIMTWSFEIKSTKKALGYCPGLHIEKKNVEIKLFGQQAMMYDAI